MARIDKKIRRAHRRQKKKKQPNNLQQALALHRAGRLLQAKTLYRQILQDDPNQPEALHYLGMLAHQIGENEIAFELICRSLACKPDYIDALVDQGNILFELGRLNEAIACFRQARKLKPDSAVTYFNLGNTHKELGELDKAVSCYRQALSLKPDYAVVYNNLGNTLKELGRLDEAIASYRQALSLKPDYVVATNLGNIFDDQGERNEAVACYRQAISLNPDYAIAHNNLGNTLKELGRMDEAIASIHKAIFLNPDLVEAHRNLGLIFSELNNMDKAIDCFKKALSIRPDYAAAYKNLTLIKKFTEIDDDVHSMEELYKKEDIPVTDRINLGFSLGKVYEDLKQYDKAFNYMLEANNLKRGLYDYSIEKDHDFFEKIKKTFSPDLFSSHLGSGNPDTTPIFIVGMPRSGTTLVEQILASHSQVFGAGELTILAELINRYCSERTVVQYPECMLDLGFDAFGKMGTEYIEKIRRYSNKAIHITDKLPDNFFRVGVIRTILPNAKVIHCSRNPMDTCFSIFKNDFTETLRYAYDMIELGQYYSLYLDLMAHWERILPGFMYTLKYEDMIADQEKQTKSLLDYCELPWDDACLSFFKTERRIRTASFAQVRKPIYKDSVGLWKSHEKQLEPLKKEIYG